MSNKPIRRQPLRKCTGCNDMKAKKELIRVVKSPEGQFSIDFTGKKSGRGAYVCNDSECLKKAEKSRGFERSFKCQIPKDVYERLREELLNGE